MRLQNPFKRRLPKGQVVWCIGLPYTKEAFLSICKKTERSDFIESLEFQYNSMDTETLWIYYEQTATKISKVIHFLRKKNVEIVDLHSVEQLKAAYTYPIIIITAHRHRYLESLDFMGNTISISEVVDSIPQSFNGVIDISSCYSSTFQMKCKQKAIKATYIAAETESSIELRLFIYMQTIKHLISHQHKCYLDSFRIIISRIVESSNKRNNKRNSVFLGGKVTPSYNHRECASAFAPNEIKRGDDMMIQIYVYKDEEHQRVICEAKKCDEDAPERSYSPLNFDIKEGDRVDVSLNVINIPQLAQTKSFIWRNKISKACFIVSIPNKYKKEKVFIETHLSVNNAILGELFFSVSVVTTYSSEKQIAEVQSRRFRKVFISYSHLDEQRVKFIAQAYKAIGVKYFFDRHYLKPGAVYPIEIRDFINSADLFILCWSKNAAESKYVTLERHQALALAYPQVDIEKATIAIHPISIEPHAEYPEDMKEVYNFEEM